MNDCEDCGVSPGEPCAVWCKCQYCLRVRDRIADGDEVLKDLQARNLTAAIAGGDLAARYELGAVIGRFLSEQ